MIILILIDYLLTPLILISLPNHSSMISIVGLDVLLMFCYNPFDISVVYRWCYVILFPCNSFKYLCMLYKCNNRLSSCQSEITLASEFCCQGLLCCFINFILSKIKNYITCNFEFNITWQIPTTNFNFILIQLFNLHDSSTDSYS